MLSIADVDNPCSEFDHGTPLHIAASNLAYEATKILVQNGADTTLKDDLGRSPAGKYDTISHSKTKYHTVN